MATAKVNVPRHATVCNVSAQVVVVLYMSPGQHHNLYYRSRMTEVLPAQGIILYGIVSHERQCMIAYDSPWFGLDGTAIAGCDLNAAWRAKIRRLNQRRQAKERRLAREAEDEWLAPAPSRHTSPAPEEAVSLPPWLEEALGAARSMAAQAPPKRRRRQASPLSDAVQALMQEHPEWGPQQVALLVGCSEALAAKVKRQIQAGER